MTDVRFSLDTHSIGPPARLYGIIVSPHAHSSSLGFERSGVRSLWPIAALVVTSREVVCEFVVDVRGVVM